MKIRILEFIVAGLAIDLMENIITIKLTTDAAITFTTVLVALCVVIPFAVLTELVIDHPNFWDRFFGFFRPGPQNSTDQSQLQVTP